MRFLFSGICFSFTARLLGPLDTAFRSITEYIFDFGECFEELLDGIDLSFWENEFTAERFLENRHEEVCMLTTPASRLIEKEAEDIEGGVGLEIKKHEKEFIFACFKGSFSSAANAANSVFVFTAYSIERLLENWQEIAYFLIRKAG